MAIGSAEEGSEVLLRSTEASQEFSVAPQIGWPRFIDEERIAYHDYNEDQIGVIDTREERVLLSAPVSGVGNKWFLGGDSEALLVQQGGTLTAHDINSGSSLTRWGITRLPRCWAISRDSCMRRCLIRHLGGCRIHIRFGLPWLAPLSNSR